MERDKELTSRTIPGITWKQVAAYTAMVTVGLSAYLNMMYKVDGGRDATKINNELLKELQLERKNDRVVDDARLKTIELQIQELKLRLTVMEKFVEGYNKQK